jgi:multisubunit Na+/H+ antiporter MnhB subunit
MRLENAVSTIILVCGLVQITLGISFFLDYETLMGLGLAGAITTTLSFVILGILYSRSKNKGEVFDERFRTRWVSIIGLGYGITNIGIALLISSVFYNVGTVKDIDVLIDDIVGFIFVGWGIPLVLFALTEFTEGRKV